MDNSAMLVEMCPQRPHLNLHIQFVDSSQRVKVSWDSKFNSAITISNYLNSLRLGVNHCNQLYCWHSYVISYYSKLKKLREKMALLNMWYHANVLRHGQWKGGHWSRVCKHSTLNSLFFNFTNSLRLSKTKTTMNEFLNWVLQPFNPFTLMNI